jgi:hypothetical protein
MNQAQTVIATFTLTELPCVYTISPANLSFGSDGGTGSISVTAPNNCSWNASENVDWINITAGSSGNGDGIVSYTVLANSAADNRSDTITVAGQRHTVTQGGVSCTYTISPTSRDFTSSGGTGSFTVTTPAGCGWTASESVGWISITSGGSGNGTGTVNYSVSANATATARNANITAGGRSHRVNQAANIRPTILNPGMELIQLNDPSCNLLEGPVGSLFRITFDYTDPDGNGPTSISQARMDVAFDFPGCCDGSFNNYTWNSSLSGNGSSGTAITRQCYRFGSNGFVDVTMTIEDLGGVTSNPLTVRINKPPNSN